MITATDNWKTAMRRVDKKPVWLMELTVGSTTYTMCSGDRVYADVPNTIVSVAPFSSDVDIVERTMSASSFDVRLLDDGFFRDIIIGNTHIKNAKVLLKLGEQSLVSTDVILQFAGIIDDYYPADNNEIVLVVKEKVQLFNNLTGIGIIKQQNPLTVMRWFFSAIGVTNINENSFDPRHADNFEVGHFLISRTPTDLGNETPSMNDVGMNDPIDLGEAFNELARLVNGSLTFDSAGDLQLRRYSASATVQRHINLEDIIDFRQRSTTSHIYTKVEVAINGSMDDMLIVDDKLVTARDSAFKYQQVNTAAQNALGIDTDSRLIETYAISTSWLNGVVRDPDTTQGSPGYGNIHGDRILYDASWIKCNAHYPGGMCGTKYSAGGADPGNDDYPIPSWQAISSTRLAYLAVVAHNEDGQKWDPNYDDADYSYDTYEPEIIACSYVGVTDADDNITGDLYGDGSFTEIFDTFTVEDDSTLYIGPRYDYFPFLPIYTFGPTAEDIHWEISSRGVDGTKARRHPNRTDVDSPRVLRDVTPVWDPNGGRALIIADVTIAKYMADYIIDRFSYGAPIVEIDVGLEHADLEVLDFITFTHPRYFRDQVTSADANTKWEIISKSIDTDEGKITYTLGWVSDSVSRTITRFAGGPAILPTKTPATLDQVINSVGDLVYIGTDTFVLQG